MSSKYIQAQTFRIYGSGNAIGDTTLTLTSLKQIDGTTNITMTDFGSKGFMTLEPGNSIQEEQISFTGVTQNAGGTATLTGVKTVGFVSPYTETSGLAKAHPGGGAAVISNTAGFYNRVATKDNDETITGTWTFTSTAKPLFNANPTFSDDKELITKKYADDLAIAGSPDATTSIKGISKMSYAPASATSPIAVGDNDPRVPSQGENDALAGTSGTPSSTNKYVTNDDTSATSSASKVVRANGTGKIDVGFIPSSLFKFGGTGVDGALSISSGTTTINCSNAAVVVKNYTSISITGTGKLAFSNPNTNGTLIVLKSQGDVIITSSTNPAIDLTGMGATGGVATGSTGSGTAGNNGGGGGGMATAGTAGSGGSHTGPVGGDSGDSFYWVANVGGGGGGNNSSGGAGGTSPGLNASVAQFVETFVLGGGGGGSGETNSDGAGASGGAGGGALYVECRGNLNFTGTINAAGIAGGTAGGSQGDGGGGGGGSVVMIYDGTLVSGAGTITVTGGAGGGGGAGGTGGNGTYAIIKNTEY